MARGQGAPSAREHHAGAAAALLTGPDPVERIWLYLRERSLSHRLLADDKAVVDACCKAWKALTTETGRIRSLTAYPYLEQVSA